MADTFEIWSQLPVEFRKVIQRYARKVMVFEVEIRVYLEEVRKESAAQDSPPFRRFSRYDVVVLSQPVYRKSYREAEEEREEIETEQMTEAGGLHNYHYNRQMEQV